MITSRAGFGGVDGGRVMTWICEDMFMQARGADVQELLKPGNRLSIASGNIIETDGVADYRGC